jgi:hypothetical protein
MRVLITGGRDFADRDQIFEELDKLHGEESEIEVVYLGKIDTPNDIARQWAKTRGVDIEVTMTPRPDMLLAFFGADPEVVARCKAARVYIETIPLRKIECDHIDPTKWAHRHGSAYCKACGKWMGNLGETKK